MKKLMIIAVIKNQKCSDFIHDMKKEHESLEKIRQSCEKTNNMKLLVNRIIDD